MELIRECKNCGLSFKANMVQVKKGLGFFCSISCSSIYRNKYEHKNLLKSMPIRITCSKCGIEKQTKDFAKSKKYLKNYCKACDSKRASEYERNNREKAAISDKIYYDANINKIRKRSKDYSIKNRESISANKKIYFQSSKEKIYDSRRKKIASDIKYKLNHSIRKRMCFSLRGAKAGQRWEDLVGYSVDKLKKHLENQFSQGMNWSNYGKYGWHIDHKIPIRAFNFKSPEDEDFKRCWALENLRPLWAKENLSKGGKLDRPFQPQLSFS